MDTANSEENVANAEHSPGNSPISMLIDKADELKLNENTTSDEFNKIAREIENAIECLHGDLRSIERQISQRTMINNVESRFRAENNRLDNIEDDNSNDNSNGNGNQDNGHGRNSEEQHRFWLHRIHKAFLHKRDQVRILERVLGGLRERSIDKKYLVVNLLLDIVVVSNDLLADINESKDMAENKGELSRLLDILDKNWPEWS